MNTVEFLSAWYAGQPFTLTAIPATGGKPTGQSFTNPNAGAQWATMQNAANMNVYFHVNPGVDKGSATEGKLTGKLTKGELTALHAVHLDLDPPKEITPDQGETWRNGAMQLLRQAGPTVIICSGRGLAAYWKFDAPIPPAFMDRIEGINRALVATYNGDKAAIDASRIMKLPGTTAFPNADKQAAGWQAGPAFVVEWGGAVYGPDALEQWIGPAPVDQVQEAGLTPADMNGPMEGYGGPADDEALLAIIKRDTNYDALNPRKMPAGAFFGDMETFRAMAKAAYPDPGKMPPWDFDGSSVDNVLFNHLAYYTGGDVPRMERLFMQSIMGQREKAMKRPKYVSDSCVKTGRDARANPEKRCYRFGQMSEEALAEALATADSVDHLIEHVAKMGKTVRDDFLVNAKKTRPDLIDDLKDGVQAHLNHFRKTQSDAKFAMTKATAFRDWFMVGDDGSGQPKAVNRKSGQRINYTNFNLANKHVPPVAIMSGDKVKDVPAADYWWSHADTERYDTLAFNPHQGVSWVDPETGQLAYNTYAPPTIIATPGDVSAWLALIEFQIPDPEDREKYHTYLSLLAQRPTTRIGWALGIVGAKGGGKSTTIELARYFTDGRWGHQPGKYATGLKSSRMGLQFNSDFDEKLLVYVHEMGQGGDQFKDRVGHSAEMKDMINSPTIKIERKGVDVTEKPAFFNVIACANPEATQSFMLDDDERRWCMVRFERSKEDIAAQFGPGFWSQLYAWLGAGGMQALAHHYQTRAIRQDLDPVHGCTTAPKTTFWADAVVANMSETEILLRDLVHGEGADGFRGGWFSLASYKDACKDAGLRMPHSNSLSGMLRRAGYGRVGQAAMADRMRDTQLWKIGHPHTGQGRASVDKIAQYQAAQTATPTPVQTGNVTPMKGQQQ